MDFWHSIWAAVTDPFRYPVDTRERLFIGYLASAFVLALVVYQDLRRRNPQTVPGSLLNYLFARRVYLHKSAIADYKFFLIDRIIYALMLPVAMLSIDKIADSTEASMDQAFGAVQQPWNGESIPVLITATLAQIVVIDFVLFYVHYLLHKVPVLWEFHKVHHSAEVLTPMTVYRVHPVEVTLNINLTALASGALFGFFAHMTGGSQPELLLCGLNAVQFAFYIAGFNLRHSHIPLGFGPAASQIFVSPWMHQVHHSREAAHLDKNMGFIFAFWDRLFGTLYVPRKNEVLEFGLSDGEHVHFHKVSALYWRPVTNLLGRLVGRTTAL